MDRQQNSLLNVKTSQLDKSTSAPAQHAGGWTPSGIGPISACVHTVPVACASVQRLAVGACCNLLCAQCLFAHLKYRLPAMRDTPGEPLSDAPALLGIEVGVCCRTVILRRRVCAQHVTWLAHRFTIPVTTQYDTLQQQPTAVEYVYSTRACPTIIMSWQVDPLTNW
jgi:hypothetical protein